MSALRNLRILELANAVAGEYCGKLLADFGAEIIKVEAPGTGSDTRRQGPFGRAGGDSSNVESHTCPRQHELSESRTPSQHAEQVERHTPSQQHERSGLFAYLNTNKRSITLDTTSLRGKEVLHKLIGAVDVIVDDHPRGYLERLDIDPAGYTSRYPGLTICSITPFGYDAPESMQKARSLNVFQTSGWGYHSPSAPDPGTPPLQGAGRFLVDYESGMSAALVLAASLYWRERTGRGQFIDVSQQESMASLADYVLAQFLSGSMEASTRRTAFDLGGPATFFQCADGYVYLWLSEPAHWNGLYTLMGEPEWMLDFPERWLERHVTAERVERCRAQIAQWMKAQARADVAARAQRMGIPLVPVNTVADIHESPQMQFREFFSEVEHPVLGLSQYPTVPYRLSRTPARIETPAPLLGEHTEKILRTVAGMDARSIRPLRKTGVA